MRQARSPVFPLKDQFQAELQFPHVDAGFGAGDRAKAGGCARDGDAIRTELARVHGVIRIAEVRVVEEIKGLKPELQVLALIYEKAFLGTKIDAEDWYIGDNIAARIPKRVWGWRAKA